MMEKRYRLKPHTVTAWMMKKVQAKALHSYSMDDEKRYRLKPHTVTAWMMKKGTG